MFFPFPLMITLYTIMVKKSVKKRVKISSRYEPEADSPHSLNVVPSTDILKLLS